MILHLSFNGITEHIMVPDECYVRLLNLFKQNNLKVRVTKRLIKGNYKEIE